jgi:hypothetical protein
VLPSIVAPQQLEDMALLAAKMPEGDFAEVGVYRGGSAYRLYEIAVMQQRTLHLFDTFTGTPVHAEGLDKHKIDDEFAAPGAEATIRRIMPLARLYVGTYPKTHPIALGKLAFIHCDCDQYESYQAVIAHLWPHLVEGGALLFDDYPYLAGAKRAVEEAFDPRKLRLCGARYYVVKEPWQCRL